MAGDEGQENPGTIEAPADLKEESDTAPSHFLHHVDSIKIFEKEEYTKEHLPHHHHHHPHPSPLAAQVGGDAEGGEESPPVNPGRLHHCDSAVLTRKHLAEHSPDPDKPTSFQVGQPSESPGASGSPNSATRSSLHHVDSTELLREHPPHYTPSRLGPGKFQLGHPGLVEVAASDAEKGGEDAADEGDGATDEGGEAPEESGAEGGKRMSKNQQKKLAKKQRLAEIKAQKRAAEKAKRAADKEERKAETAAKMETMTEEEREVYIQGARAKKAERRADQDARKERLKTAMESGQRIVVDLDFEEQMNETEIRSLCQQLSYSYSANCHAEKPFHLHLASLKGHLEATLRRQAAGLENWHLSKDSACYTETFRDCKEDIVYLTADSSDTLTELDASKVYIIGGIVDRNRHKGICLERAKAAGVATAALPIGPHLHMTGSKVLTVNQVVEIMLRFSECGDWKQALLTVVPERKRGQGNEGGEGAPSAKQQKT